MTQARNFCTYLIWIFYNYKNNRSDDIEFFLDFLASYPAWLAIGVRISKFTYLRLLLVFSNATQLTKLYSMQIKSECHIVLLSLIKSIAPILGIVIFNLNSDLFSEPSLNNCDLLTDWLETIDKFCLLLSKMVLSIKNLAIKSKKLACTFFKK
jgi:hypothetical protein